MFVAVLNHSGSVREREREGEKSDLECSSIGSLEIGHAIKRHAVCQQLPQNNAKAIDVHLISVMLFLSSAQCHGAVQLPCIHHNNE